MSLFISTAIDIKSLTVIFLKIFLENFIGNFVDHLEISQEIILGIPSTILSAYSFGMLSVNSLRILLAFPLEIPQIILLRLQKILNWNFLRSFHRNYTEEIQFEAIPIYETIVEKIWKELLNQFPKEFSKKNKEISK